MCTNCFSTRGGRYTVKCFNKAAVLLLTAAALQGSAQATPEDQSRSQDTQARGFWVDPSTKLMWAGKDSGKDLSWKNAAKYCRNLRLAGYSDWRLATLSELEGIFDKSANVAGLAPLGAPPPGKPFTWHVKGNLFLTGDQWSSSQRTDDRGHPNGYAWHFDFSIGQPKNDPTGFPYPYDNRRALCVRSSGR